MKPVHKHLVLAACLAVLGLSAGAQPAQPATVAPATAPGQRPMMHDHGERMQQRMARRETALKQILQITPAQDGAWSTWIASRRPSANTPRQPRSDLSELTTPQRIDRMRELRAQRSAEMDRRAEATKTFYAALTPSQQKAFDALSARHGRGGDGMRGHHGEGWGHRG